MKKLFVSVPMRGRNKKDIYRSIEKMKRIAEVTVGEPLELIDSYIDTAVMAKNEGAYYLGESIKRMADADYMITTTRYYEYVGCRYENEIASTYGIKVLFADAEFVCPDLNNKVYGEPMNGAVSE